MPFAPIRARARKETELVELNEFVKCDLRQQGLVLVTRPITTVCSTNDSLISQILAFERICGLNECSTMYVDFLPFLQLPNQVDGC
jgi:hypothetical protein